MSFSYVSSYLKLWQIPKSLKALNKYWRMCLFKAISKFVWNMSSKWKYASKWMRYLMLTFLEVFSPFDHVLKALWEKLKSNLPRLYSCFCCHYWILQNMELLPNCESFLHWVCETSKAWLLQLIALKERCERTSSLTDRNHLI